MDPFLSCCFRRLGHRVRDEWARLYAEEEEEVHKSPVMLRF